MIDVFELAKYILEKNKNIDEMKLHKLLYLIQREYIAMTNNFLFSENFEAWKYGPVIKKVRNRFKNLKNNKKNVNISSDIKYIIDNVLNKYMNFSSFELSILSHDEISWKIARKNCNFNDKSSYKMDIEDIKKDAFNLRIYDSFWDMYVDEFEDFDDR